MPERGPLESILCVDDEPNILDGIKLNLRRHFEVLTATSGSEGLRLLEANPSVVVIISDMRMPEMDGATFLSRAKQVAPNATRLLLTGQADLESTIQAVNEGQIFRFLAKPCPPATLLAAVETAAEQAHRLVTSERVLLEQTLRGWLHPRCWPAFLALTNLAWPSGRAMRVKTLVSELAAKVDLPDRWQVEVAAVLSQLGFISLPPATVEKLYVGNPLSADEQKMVARLPIITEQILAHIPRLETVRAMLAQQAKPPAGKDLSKIDAKDRPMLQGAEMLRLAIELDELESRGRSTSEAVATIQGRANRYDPTTLSAFLTLNGLRERQRRLRSVPLNALAIGMVLLEDVRLTNGSLLVARGYEVTGGFLERAKNFRAMIVEPLKVTTRDDVSQIVPYARPRALMSRMLIVDDRAADPRRPASGHAPAAHRVGGLFRNPRRQGPRAAGDRPSRRRAVRHADAWDGRRSVPSAGQRPVPRHHPHHPLSVCRASLAHAGGQRGPSVPGQALRHPRAPGLHRSHPQAAGPAREPRAAAHCR